MNKFKELQEVYKQGGNIFAAWANMPLKNRLEVARFLKCDFQYGLILARIKGECNPYVCKEISKLSIITADALRQNDEGTLNYIAQEIRRLQECIDVHYCNQITQPWHIKSEDNI